MNASMLYLADAAYYGSLDRSYEKEDEPFRSKALVGSKVDPLE